MVAGEAPMGALFSNARIEVIPTKSVGDQVEQLISKDVTIAVTASPVKGLDSTFELAERLCDAGFNVVPHLSARLVVDEKHLAEIVARLTERKISDVFVPAGDADPPAGKFDSSLSLLEALDQMGRPFDRVGITGYPESHPKISDDVTVQAMWDKRHYASYVISNLCFDPTIIRHWVERVRKRGVKLPIYLGVAAPIDRTKLLDVASKIGVGESTKFLTKHAAWFLRMGTPGGYSPNRLLQRIGSTLTTESSLIEGLHIYSFNQIRQSEEWRVGQLEKFGGTIHEKALQSHPAN
ncbi:MAG: 5,10-methylenetetrahydrofolate reductase [Acidimicrobiaceae bacterium]|nr:5,10-methylenetetrahydrofolate reductase [Acidimicrobiaceae bacterium]